MSFWNPNEVISINNHPEDSGLGDNLYDAFTKVNNNFGNISTQLGQPTQDFLNANVELQLNTNYLTVANAFVSNLNAVDTNITGNFTVSNITVNNSSYVNGQAYFYDNLNLSGDIVPSSDAVYNLGSPTRKFANLYVQQTISTTQINQSSDSSILVIHANSAGNSDVGILGNVTDRDMDGDAGANSYAFFGYQLSSDNFVYKITPTNPILGNSIVYDGYYGGAQFGTLILSNTTVSSSTSTGALTVSGGVGIAGALNVGGTANAAAMYSGGYQVLTTNTPGLTNYSGTTIANLVITGVNNSTSTSTGALILSFGGAGIAGNVYSGGNVVATTGLVGPYYGTIQTAAQPNITSLGSLNGLQIGTGTIGTPSISISGTGVTGAPLTVSAGGANIAGNLFSTGTITSTGSITAASFVGDGSGLTGVVSSSQFNTLNANVGAYEIWANANVAGLYSSIATLNANVGAFEITTNANIGGHQVSIGAINANLGAYQTWSNANVGTLSTTVATHTTNINTINANLGAYQIYANANIGTISTSLSTLNANVGAYEIYANANIGTVINSINNVTTNANANVIAYIGKNALSVGGQLTVTGSIVPSANVTYNLGSSTYWYNLVYGKAYQAQYADLAENYASDAEYEPGTVVVFGGDAEITVTTEFADTRVAGAVSTDPAYLMNGAAGGLPVALRGRVPCKVTGPVNKGDLLVTSNTPGYAQSVGNDKKHGPAVFAKSLETNLTDGDKIITAVIL